MSDDEKTITFSLLSSPTAGFMLIPAFQDGVNIGYLDGYRLPFTAVKNEEQVTMGGIVGTSYNTFLEKCFYGDSCVGDNHNEVGTVLPSSELLSDAQVRTMNSAASGIVLSDPFVSSLKMWRPGENGPALIEEDYVQSIGGLRKETTMSRGMTNLVPSSLFLLRSSWRDWLIW